MKKFLTVFTGMVLFSFQAFAFETEDAEKFARKLANDIITEVVQPKIALSDKQERFRKLFMNAINVKTNARFTLGQYAKKAAAEDLQNYTDALADNIIYTWTDRFNGYAGGSLTTESIVFGSTRKSDKGDFYVKSEINLPDTENDIEMIWRVSEKKGELKLADLVVEGVSMLMSYRNEYTAVLKQNGGDIPALTEMLRKKNESLKNPAGSGNKQ